MKNKWIYPAVCLLFALAFLTYSCGKSSGYSSGSGSTTPPPSPNAVTIAGMSFSPGNLSVVIGTTVTWTNNDAMTHTVTADGGSFDSGNLAPAGKFSKTFSTVGTFPYHCAIHSGMAGSIVVRAY